MSAASRLRGLPRTLRSGSWLGYHARIYTSELRPRRPGEYFDVEWGFEGAFSNRTTGEWAEFDHGAVVEAIYERAAVSRESFKAVEQLASRADRTFNDTKGEILATVDAALATEDDKVLQATRTEIAGLTGHFSTVELAQSQVPKNHRTRDTRAGNGGINVPAHVQVRADVMSKLSYGSELTELAKKARYLVKYLEKRRKMSGKSIGKKTGKVFIGHGRAPDWRELKDFVQERLKLEVDEFNRVSVAGLANKERLEAMLDGAVFALLVLTAEDEQADGTKHARANVIHETGLFQGRLGFERAIVLFEEGCEEFSNVSGIVQLRFPKGRISAIFEEVRQVLEREGLLT